MKSSVCFAFGFLLLVGGILILAGFLQQGSARRTFEAMQVAVRSEEFVYRHRAGRRMNTDPEAVQREEDAALRRAGVDEFHPPMGLIVAGTLIAVVASVFFAVLGAGYVLRKQPPRN